MSPELGNIDPSFFKRYMLDGTAAMEDATKRALESVELVEGSPAAEHPEATPSAMPSKESVRARTRDRAPAAPPPNSPPPPVGPTGPALDEYDDPMDARLDKLEAFAETAKDRLSSMETKLDQLVGEVGQFKWFLLGAALTMVVTVVTTVIATGVGIQQMTVATFQGAAQVARESAPANPAPTQQPVIINIPPQQVVAPAK